MHDSLAYMHASSLKSAYLYETECSTGVGHLHGSLWKSRVSLQPFLLKKNFIFIQILLIFKT